MSCACLSTPLDELGERAKAKRALQRQSLRVTAAEIGVSFNALFRFERGAPTDVENYRRIVAWLGFRCDQGLPIGMERVRLAKSVLDQVDKHEGIEQRSPGNLVRARAILVSIELAAEVTA